MKLTTHMWMLCVAAALAGRCPNNSIVMAKTVAVAQEQAEIVEPLLGALQVPPEAVTEIHGVEQRAATGK